MYGTGGPHIWGRSHCSALRASASASRPVEVGVAGLFNTGTNALHKLLAANCKGAGVHIWWQVPWGKHNPIDHGPKQRGHHLEPWAHSAMPHVNDSATDPLWARVLPVVIVKDPLTWMRSMCKSPYAANFKGRMRLSCPSPVEKTETKVFFSQDMPGHEHDSEPYASLPHFWNKWYGAYANKAQFPFLMVRYEDLLFQPEKMVNEICSCVGSSAKQGTAFEQVHGAAKTGVAHRGSSDRGTALKRYADAQWRLAPYSAADLDFVRGAIDPGLLRFFSYLI